MLLDRKQSSLTNGPQKNWLAIPDEKVFPGKPYTLRIFVDHSVLTIFAPSGRVLTARIYPSLVESIGVQLVSAEAATTFNLTAWPLVSPPQAEVLAQIYI